MNDNKYNLLTILGPTATGKTTLAANLAYQLNGEIISADSRQVYKNMDIGTGKDLDDYIVNGKQIPYHLIDIADPGDKYNVYEFQKDFVNVYTDIHKRNCFPLLCGGSGLYIEAVLKAYSLLTVPVNNDLRAELDNMTTLALTRRLASLEKLHNTTDTKSRKRLIRAIEIAEYTEKNKLKHNDYPDIRSLVVGVKFDRDTRRIRITNRLQQRLDNGMIDEIRSLHEKGLTTEQLIYYGLEYKFITLYLTGELSYDEMFAKLNTAIHQFAKRQMTWFRRMERNGIKINWVDGNLPLEEKIKTILQYINL